MNYKRTWNKQTVLLTFVAKNSVGLTAEIYGILSGIPVKFRMPNPNGCQSSNITCPIKSGDQYTYSGLFNVLPTYPNVSIWSVCLYITLLLDFMKKKHHYLIFRYIMNRNFSQFSKHLRFFAWFIVHFNPFNEITYKVSPCYVQ